MKKVNVVLLGLLGTTAMISSFVLFATFWQKPVETTKGVVTRTVDYATAPFTGTTRTKKYSVEKLRQMGLNDKEIQHYLDTDKLPERFKQ